MFFCDFYEMFKNNIFREHLLLLPSAQYETAIISILKTPGICNIKHYIYVLRYCSQLSIEIYEYFSELFRFCSTKKYRKIYKYLGK